MRRFRKSYMTRGGVAQLVERLLCKQNVAGSIPVASTISIEYSQLSILVLQPKPLHLHGHIRLNPSALVMLLHLRQ